MFQLELMMITIIEYDQNLIKLLYFNSFVAIKTLLRYDCFNKDSRCLDLSLRSSDNFDTICVFLHGYKLFQTGSCSFKLVAGVDSVAANGFGLVVADVFGWFRRFQVVSDDFGWFCNSFSSYVSFT